jgi:hypothetical protein
MSVLTVPVPVPASGDGPTVDVSSLVGPKTVQLSGNFRGYYDLLASQDDINFDAVASFDPGGDAGIEQTVPGAFKSFRLRANVSQVISPVACQVSAVLGTGENGFGTIASLAAGFSGLTPAVDTSTFIPPTGSEEDTVFLCRGAFQGQVIVLGSSDGVEFNPVGSFSADRLPEGAPPTLELAPLTTLDKTRYVRLQVPGTTTGPTVVTLGGRVPAGAAGTPMPMFVVDSGGATALQALAQGVVTTFGADSVVIGNGAAATAAATQAVVLGANASAGQVGAVAIGMNSSNTGPVSVVVGPNCSVVGAPGSIAIGLGAQVLGGSGNTAIGEGVVVAGSNNNTAIGVSCGVTGSESIAIGGAGANVGNGSESAVAIGTGCAVGNTVVSDNSVGIGTQTQVNGLRILCAGFANVVSSDDSVALGQSNFIDAVSAGTVCLGQGCQVGTSSADCVVIGNGSTVGANSLRSIVVGTGCSVGTFSVGIAVGTNAVLSDNSGGIAVGTDSHIGVNSTGTAVGDGATIGDGSSAGHAFGNAAIIGKNTSWCLVIGSNPQSLDGSTNSIVVGRLAIAGASTNAAVVVGLSARSDFTNSQAYGAGATTSQTDEVVFGTPTPVVGGGAGPLRLFHAYPALSGKELLRFDSDALVGALDSAMYLLYKDSGAVVRFSKVTVQAVTGYLKVSPV